MQELDPLFLSLTFLLASIPVGGFAYGFSATANPLLLVRYTPRQVSPILNFVEIFQNMFNLFYNYKRVKIDKGAVSFALSGLPGIVGGSVLGGYFLSLSFSGSSLKLVVYLTLLPLILMQAYGLRKPVELSNWRKFGSLIVFPVGVLYGISTISGPPLAILINNQGLSKDHFKFAIALLRTAESLTAFLVYLKLGIFSSYVIRYAALTSPAIVSGMLIGMGLSRLVSLKEDFRRACMSFDAYITSYGLSNSLASVSGVGVIPSLFPMLLTTVIDTLLLIRYIRVQRPRLIRVTEEDQR
jgi:hypothetical protein